MTDFSNIEREFRAGNLDYIDAIERLQQTGWLNALDAEALVEKWEREADNDAN